MILQRRPRDEKRNKRENEQEGLITNEKIYINETTLLYEQHSYANFIWISSYELAYNKLCIDLK